MNTNSNETSQRGRELFVACLTFFASVTASSPVLANDPVSGDWQFQVTPYIWALSAEGDITVKGQEADFDLSFRDIVEDLNYGLMLQGDVRKGRIGVYANLLYANLGDEETVGPVKVDPEVNMFWGGLGAYYRLGPYDLDRVLINSEIHLDSMS